MRSYYRDVRVAELSVHVELAGERTVTAREMRFAERNGDGTYAAPLSFVGARVARHHFPALAVARADGSLVAIEFELASKRTRRLLAVLKAYRRAPHFESVVYYCDLPRVRRRVERLARDLHIDDRVVVTPWERR